jgi:2',3'-cyclic-nucleotide 2'-phosphodiesterase (5'-nucleotidase family)
MGRLVLLHTNDLHGRVEALARIATLVERIRAEEGDSVVYVDTGDVEETTTRISNLTKGAAMHRLLSAAGCEAHAVGNAAWLRYGAGVLVEHAREATYPLLLANLRTREGGQLPGTQSTAILERGGVRVGLIGVTDRYGQFLDSFDYGISALPEVETVRELAQGLRAEGADLVVALSHLGYSVEQVDVDDVRLAPQVADVVDLIVGAHSHDLLPSGTVVDGVLIAQAGSHGEFLGRIELTGDAASASVIEIPAETPPHPAVLDALAAAERELGAHLDEPIGELPADVGPAWVAEILRRRMDADVAVVTPGQVLTRPLVPGVVRRRALWEACESTANPGVVEMTGGQLAALLEKGRDPEFARTTARPLRGRERGELVVGADEIAPGRTYRVAGTDFELGVYGGYVEPGWGLRPRYDFPVIVREAIEQYLAAER